MVEGMHVGYASCETGKIAGFEKEGFLEQLIRIKKAIEDLYTLDKERPETHRIKTIYELMDSGLWPRFLECLELARIIQGKPIEINAGSALTKTNSRSKPIVMKVFGALTRNQVDFADFSYIPTSISGSPRPALKSSDSQWIINISTVINPKVYRMGQAQATLGLSFNAVNKLYQEGAVSSQQNDTRLFQVEFNPPVEPQLRRSDVSTFYENVGEALISETTKILKETLLHMMRAKKIELHAQITKIINGFGEYRMVLPLESFPTLRDAESTVKTHSDSVEGNIQLVYIHISKTEPQQITPTTKSAPHLITPASIIGISSSPTLANSWISTSSSGFEHLRITDIQSLIVELKRLYELYKSIGLAKNSETQVNQYIVNQIYENLLDEVLKKDEFFAFHKSINCLDPIFEQDTQIRDGAYQSWIPTAYILLIEYVKVCEFINPHIPIISNLRDMSDICRIMENVYRYTESDEEHKALIFQKRLENLGLQFFGEWVIKHKKAIQQLYQQYKYHQDEVERKNIELLSLITSENRIYEQRLALMVELINQLIQVSQSAMTSKDKLIELQNQLHTGSGLRTWQNETSPSLLLKTICVQLVATKLVSKRQIEAILEKLIDQYGS